MLLKLNQVLNDQRTHSILVSAALAVTLLAGCSESKKVDCEKASAAIGTMRQQGILWGKSIVEGELRSAGMPENEVAKLSRAQLTNFNRQSIEQVSARVNDAESALREAVGCPAQ